MATTPRKAEYATAKHKAAKLSRPAARARKHQVFFKKNDRSEYTQPRARSRDCSDALCGPRTCVLLSLATGVAALICIRTRWSGILDGRRAPVAAGLRSEWERLASSFLSPP